MHRMPIVMCSVLLGAGYALGQPAPTPSASADSTAGMYWPTDRVVDLFIDRFTEAMAQRYTFDETQMLKTRAAIKARFPAWLSEHRAEIQGLFNEYLESALSPEPPTPAQAADWAQRAMPLFQEGLGMAQNTMQEMYGFLNEEQAARVARHEAALGVITGVVTQRLERWAAGGFVPEDEWVRSETFVARQPAEEENLRAMVRQARVAAKRLNRAGQALGGGTTIAPPPPTGNSGQPAVTPDAAPHDDWAVYVEQFIQKYQLNEAQQNKAREFLRQAQDERTRYLSRKSAEIKALERRVAAAKADAEREELRADYEDLVGPVEDTFKRLKQKLGRLPTSAQRKAAGEDPKAARQQPR
ncbi:MAG: hypothetical protein AB1716_11610 [Planctomycetota bacterium]